MWLLALQHDWLSSFTGCWSVEDVISSAMASNKVERVNQLFVLWENKYEVLHCAANKGLGMAGPGGNLMRALLSYKLCERFSPKKTLCEIHWREIKHFRSFVRAAPAPSQGLATFPATTSVHPPSIEQNLLASLLFNVRISALKEISLSACILWQLQRLEMCLTYLGTRGSYSFRKQIVSFRFDVKYPEGCLLFPSLPSKKQREGATNLSWGSS